MATASRPPFTLSKTFIEPTIDCDPMPADVIESAEEIVRSNSTIFSRQTDSFPDPVPSSTLTRILAFDARKTQARYTEAYLNDDAIHRFLLAICCDRNLKARDEQLKTQPIDLEASIVRAVSFDPVWWPTPAQKFQRGQMSSQEMADTFWKALKRHGVASATAFLELQVLFLPRCKNNHWTLNFVCPRKKIFGTLNSATDDAPSTAFVRNFVRSFLESILGPLYRENDWREVSDTARPAESAQQQNPTDCGAVLCLSAAAIATDQPPSCVHLQNMRGIREAIAGTLVLGGFTSGLWEL